MTIIHAHAKDGGFYCMDTATGRAAYAYPSSSNASLAERMPDRIAADMMHGTNLHSTAHPSVDLDAFHARLAEELRAILAG